MIQQAPNAGEPLLQIAVRRPKARLAAVEGAIRKSHTYFLGQQHPGGYWLAPLEADVTLESDYVLLLRFLKIDDETKIEKAARRIRSRQLPSGGWNIYEGGPDEISATVKAYTALKLSGASINDEALVRARAAIQRLGGLNGINTYTRAYLHLIGQFPHSGIPAIPPEVILLPRWSYFNIYEISAWSRTILVPLSIIYALRPRTEIPDSLGIAELYGDEIANTGLSFERSKEVLSWRNFFLLTDRLLKMLERSPIKPLRKRALKRAEEWMLARMENSGALGAIYPAMMNSIIALKALGYSSDHLQMRRALEELDKLIMDQGDKLQFQPCESPVWDTGLTMLALLKSGLSPSHPNLVRAASWLLDKQTVSQGDWSVKNKTTPPGGWYFQFNNEFYPDLDDTCVALMVLKLIRYPDRSRNRLAQEKGLRWLLDMQCRNGGWASFDRDNDHSLFTHVPFADHNAMLDPPTADITGRILEMLSYFGYTRRSACVVRAIRFLRQEQEPDGSWFGRWGVNYLYGTWQVLKGLNAIGEDLSQPYVQNAAQWLRSRQNSDGGWGESCESYQDRSQGEKGPSTPSQTAWAVMGLISSGDCSSPTLLRGIDYLLHRQNPRGDWDEPQFTGTGFPGVFYLRYQYYRNYFPLFALGMFQEFRDRPAPGRRGGKTGNQFDQNSGVEA